MKDITGNRYGTLSVVYCTGFKSSNGDYLWKCLCDCGNTTVTTIGRLNSSHTKSCGCLRGKGGLTHGMTKTKAYKSWAKIRERCKSESCPEYESYGARGIKLHSSFEDFLEFYKEIGDPPSSKHTVDRIDNTKGYEPGNIRWATPYQQAQNKGKQRNNTSGNTGVIWYFSGHSSHATYAVAQWREYDKPCNKKFSVKKYGLLEAFALATTYRELTLIRLNQAGANYTANHGKV